jgi:hypothetical protein
VIGTRIQLRRDTAANWTASNPVLRAGEPGFETDTGKQKVGTGMAAWINLPYQGLPILVGEGPPSNSIGVVEQFYWDKTAKALWGPKELVGGAIGPFPTSSILDTFVRAPENPLNFGGLWGAPFYLVGGGSLGPLAVTTSGHVSIGGGNNASAIWKGGPYTDQEIFSKVEIGTWANQHLRVTAAEGSQWTTGYRAKWEKGFVTLKTAGEATLGSASVTIAPSDDVGMRAVGSTITLWHRPIGAELYTLVLTATDSSAPSGKIGLACFGSSDVFTSFGGGAVVRSSVPEWPALPSILPPAVLITNAAGQPAGVVGREYVNFETDGNGLLLDIFVGKGV